ncbi:TPA: hypothetical protein DDZ86_01580 [Candidatus Dependentiae bacterium]|nr:MAG: hypothetical protein UW09_C0001G0320 [candidate division TM6 bacterium GW2011_GWF2_43_87]HBL98315.1 hypothetical protein [Candidatus Dependentiae bacterium]
MYARLICSLAILMTVPYITSSSACTYSQPQTADEHFLKLDYKAVYNEWIKKSGNPINLEPLTKITTETQVNKRTFSQFSSKAGSSIKFRKITFIDETICYPSPSKGIQKTAQINKIPSKQSTLPVQATTLTTPTTSAIQDCISQPATNPNKLSNLTQLLNGYTPQVAINKLIKSKNNNPPLFTQLIAQNSDEFIESVINHLYSRSQTLKTQARNLYCSKLLAMVKNCTLYTLEAKKDATTLMLNKMAQKLVDLNKEKLEPKYKQEFNKITGFITTVNKQLKINPTPSGNKKKVVWTLKGAPSQPNLKK